MSRLNSKQLHKVCVKDYGCRNCWKNYTLLYCDNKAVISISHNPVQHDKTKHIEVDRHFIKEKIEKGTICMTYIPTREQLAYIFTKGLQRSSFEDFICKLDMVNIYDPT